MNKLKSFFLSKEWKLLWSFYIFDFLFSATAFYMPIYVLFFQNQGISIAEIGLIFIAYRVSKIIFEIPTGVIADVYGRKFSTILGSLLTYIIWVLISFSSNFESILILYIVMGFSFTFISGAQDAWIYDWLKYNRSKKLYTRYVSRSTMINSLGYIISPLIGGFLAKIISLNYILLITGIFGIIFSLLWIPIKNENFYRKKIIKKSDFWKTFREALSFIKKTPLFLYLIIGATSYSILYSVWELIEQPFLFSIGNSYELIGIIIAIMAFLGFISPIISMKLENKFSNIDKILFFDFIAYSLFISIYFLRETSFYIIISVLLLAWLFHNIPGPFFRTELNKLMPSKVRATVLSFNGILYSLAFIIGLSLSSLLSNLYGIAAPLLILIPNSIYGIFFFFLYRLKSKAS